MKYPAKFTKVDGGYGVTFRDIPEAITQGATLAEAQEMAQDALITSMDFYFEDNRPVPIPSALQDDEQIVSLPLSVWSKVLLLNALIDQRVSQADLAKRMGIQRQQVTRIVNLSHATKIDTIEHAFEVLGKKLTLSIS